MNPFVDALMLILFVLFMVYIFRGYHINRLAQLEEEERKSKEKSGKKEGE